MKYRDRVKLLSGSEEIKEATKSFLEDAAAAILGDPIAAVRIINSLRKAPAFLQQEWFITKLNAFLGGLDLDEEEIRKLGEKLEEDGDKNDNAIFIFSVHEWKTQMMFQYEFMRFII